MNLIEKINQDFKDAYKNGEMEKKNFLGLVRGEATKQSKEPDDIDVVKVLKAFEKSLTSTLEASDLTSLSPDWNENHELVLIKSYLPKQMSDSEIQSKIDELISAGASNIGQIMGAFKGLDADMRLVKEKADTALKS